jgi:hypothetical protein
LPVLGFAFIAASTLVCFASRAIITMSRFIAGRSNVPPKPIDGANICS